MVSVSRFCISGKLAASDTTLVFDTLEMLEKKEDDRDATAKNW